MRDQAARWHVAASRPALSRAWCAVATRPAVDHTDAISDAAAAGSSSLALIDSNPGQRLHLFTDKPSYRNGLVVDAGGTVATLLTGSGITEPSRLSGAGYGSVQVSATGAIETSGHCSGIALQRRDRHQPGFGRAELAAGEQQRQHGPRPRTR